VRLLLFAISRQLAHAAGMSDRVGYNLRKKIAASGSAMQRARGEIGEKGDLTCP
jgi:hypothetical protein